MNDHNPLATILKIMNHFVKDMGDTAELRLQGSPLVDKLVKKGFRPEDIATAMRCLGVMAVQSGQGNPARPGADPIATGPLTAHPTAATTTDPRETPVPGAAPSPTPTDPGELRAAGLRQLHAAEAIRLSPEAQQLLLGLLEAGQISPLHFEKTIEYIWKSDLREVTASRLQLLLYMNDPNPNRGGAPFLSDRVTKPDFIN
ncbi:MAG: DUF494 family protein [Candidatus Riflebacteria bacterium]|nr:DUF494 family protein [Candidatus Riflebacteria bacterium]